MVKVDVWIQTRDQIPRMAERTGLSVETIVEQFENAERQDLMCVFQVEMTQEQYERGKRMAS